MQGKAERDTFSTAVVPEGAGVLLGDNSECSGGLLQRRPSRDRSCELSALLHTTRAASVLVVETRCCTAYSQRISSAKQIPVGSVARSCCAFQRTRPHGAVRKRSRGGHTLRDVVRELKRFGRSYDLD